MNRETEKERGREDWIDLGISRSQSLGEQCNDAALAGVPEYGSVSLDVIKVALLTKAAFRPNQALQQNTPVLSFSLSVGRGIRSWDY